MSKVGVSMSESGSERLVNKADLLDGVAYVYVTVEFHRFDGPFELEANGEVRVLVRDELDVVLDDESTVEELSNEDVIVARSGVSVPSWSKAKQNPTGRL